MTILSFPITHFCNNGSFDKGLLALQKQGRFTPPSGRVTVILDNKTGDIAIMPKGTNTSSRQQLALNDFSLSELEELADKTDKAMPGGADELKAAIMLLRPRMAENNVAFYLFAESPNALVVAPAPVKAINGFA